MVPDPWVDDAVRETQHGLSPRLARERRVVGLDDDPGSDTAGVRQVLVQATQSLHLALDPGSPGPPDPGTRGGDGKAGRERIFRSLPGGDVTTGRAATLAIGRGTIALGTRSAGHGGGSMHETRIETKAILAVLEDPAGTLALIDEDQQVLTFHPQLFKRHKELIRHLEPVLAGLPRLLINNGADPAAMRQRRGRAKRWPAWLLAGSAALVACLAVMIAVTNIDDPQVTGRITIGETARLGNGTTITATGFERRPTAADDMESQVAVQVRFCAGSDTKDAEFPPETQRSVAPADFAMLNQEYAYARLVDSDSQLRRDSLAQGQCAVGDLVFKGIDLSVPRLAYKNAFGDDVVWYSPGQVPPAQ
jgi:hypothetical protein